MNYYFLFSYYFVLEIVQNKLTNAIVLEQRTFCVPHTIRVGLVKKGMNSNFL